MPMPGPTDMESESEFVARFMANPAMMKDFPYQKQRLAVAYSRWRKAKGEADVQTVVDRIKEHRMKEHRE